VSSKLKLDITEMLFLKLNFKMHYPNVHLIILSYHPMLEFLNSFNNWDTTCLPVSYVSHCLVIVRMDSPALTYIKLLSMIIILKNDLHKQCIMSSLWTIFEKEYKFCNRKF
jgi:hypothetical protein